VRTPRLRRIGLAAAAGVLVAATLTSAVVSPAAAAPSVQAQLAQVRNGTAAFHDLAQAEAAGYVHAPLPCFDDPTLGGMGDHWLLPPALGQPLDPTRPAALVYEPERDGTHRLVAVEYIVPGTAGMTPPQLLGQEFTFLEALGLWKLHAWIWRPNPAGMFADYNPNAARCPAA
jgi:hypothetical protein